MRVETRDARLETRDARGKRREARGETVEVGGHSAAVALHTFPRLAVFTAGSLVEIFKGGDGELVSHHENRCFCLLPAPAGAGATCDVLAHSAATRPDDIQCRDLAPAVRYQH